MKKKFNIKGNNCVVQLTDGSIFFIRLIKKYLIVRFEKDFRFLNKWKFRVFSLETNLLEEKFVDRFKNKFIKLF